MEFVFCWPATLGHPLTLKTILFPQWDCLAKKKFSLASGYQPMIGSGLGVSTSPLSSRIPTPTLYTVSTSFSTEFTGPWREGFNGDVLFSTGCCKISHSFILSGCGSLYLFPSATWGNVSHDGWARHRSIRRMSLGVILLLCSFSKTVVFGFTLCPWAI